jgi:transposase-like protein
MMTAEGVTNVARGRTVDPNTKKRALDEYLAGARAIDVAARHQISVKLLYNWKSNHKLDASGKKNESVKVRHLERMLRHKEEENAVLRDLLKKTYQVMPLDAKS